MLTIMMWMAALIAGVIVLDRVVMWVLPKIAPFVPDDYCGPDGWLTDTRSALGVFDRAKR